MSSLRPGMPIPDLTFRTTDDRPWSIRATAPAALDLIAIYRGSFCPYCKGFISELASRRTEFRERGITPVALSMDSEENARRAVAEWELGDLTVGYGLDAATARRWEVLLTSREQEGKLLTFCEPALRLVTPDKRLYALFTQSLPCGRPDLANLLQGLDYLAGQGYPIRGGA